MPATTKSALRKAGLFYFVWVMFSYCTGGPFGLEDMVTTSGPGTGAIETSAKAAIFELGLHVMLSTFAPRLFAYFIAPKV